MVVSKMLLLSKGALEQDFSCRGCAVMVRGHFVLCSLPVCAGLGT